jgi:hypothetical protein
MIRIHSLISLAAMLSAAPFTFAQNTGCHFDPTIDGFIEVPFASQLVPQSGITVEAWFTYDETTVPTGWRYPTIMRQGIGASGENIMLRMNGDQNAAANRVLRWRVRTTNGVNVTTDYSFQPGEFLPWTHVAGTYDGNTLALYINGVMVSSVPGNGLPIMQVNEVLRIGKGSDVATPIEVFNGDLDEVRLWPFARTAEDIQKTMDLELVSIPGYVSTWNLNNDFTDSSSGQNAVSGGTVTFASNTLNLTQPAIAFGLPQGNSTPGCNGDLLLCSSGPSVINYNDYRLVCTRTEPNGLVFWGASAATLPSALPLLGVDVWLDPTNLILVGGVADALGSASVSIPIPGNVSGFAFAAQCVAFDACGPQGFTASNAMIVIVQ